MSTPKPRRRAGFGGLIASGWQTAAIMMRLFVDHFLSKTASLASPGHRRIALDPAGPARRRAAHPGHGARRDAIAIAARPRHGAQPGRGAEPERRNRHDPEADEPAALPGRALKIGIVSDLHCNHRGLLRALDIIGEVDELVCLGDSIYEYRFSNEVVQLLRERGAHAILGNHEEGFLGPHGARARARRAGSTARCSTGSPTGRIGSNCRSAGKGCSRCTRRRGSRAAPMFIRTVLSWRGSARPRRISCSTATPIISWCAASAGCW